jgi:hypothetical protein
VGGGAAGFDGWSGAHTFGQDASIPFFEESSVIDPFLSQMNASGGQPLWGAGDTADNFNPRPEGCISLSDIENHNPHPTDGSSNTFSEFWERQRGVQPFSPGARPFKQPHQPWSIAELDVEHFEFAHSMVSFFLWTFRVAFLCLVFNVDHLGSVAAGFVVHVPFCLIHVFVVDTRIATPFVLLSFSVGQLFPNRSAIRKQSFDELAEDVRLLTAEVAARLDSSSVYFVLLSLQRRQFWCSQLRV